MLALLFILFSIVSAVCPDGSTEVTGCTSTLMAVAGSCNSGEAAANGNLEIWVNTASAANEMYDMVTNGIFKSGALTADSISTTGKVTADSITTTGALEAASITTTGALDADSISTGVIEAASITTTGALSAASISTSGAVSASTIDASTIDAISISTSGTVTAGGFQSAYGDVNVPQGTVTAQSIAVDSVISTCGAFMNTDSGAGCSFAMDVSNLQVTKDAAILGGAMIKGGAVIHGYVALQDPRVGFEGSYYYIGDSMLLVSSSNWGSEKISLASQGAIMSNTYIGASDRRIKKDIRNVVDTEALNIIRKLEAKHYKYKDSLGRGTRGTIGFIAQDVNATIPVAVTIISEFIPNEMRLIDPSWVEENGQWTMVMKKSLIPGEYKFFMGINATDTNEILLVTEDGKTFSVEAKYDEVYLYGIKVHDFHTIDKNKIFAVAYAALQQVDKNQQALQAKVATLETVVDVLTERLNALESR